MPTTSKPRPLKIRYGEYPPNYGQIQTHFKPSHSMVFTYGDTCYVPNSAPLPEHLKVHEAIHAQQQTDPEAWWAKFCSDPKFQLEQELEAYRAQYHFVESYTRNKRKLYTFLINLALDLSSHNYGNIVSRHQASLLIKQKV